MPSSCEEVQRLVTVPNVGSFTSFPLRVLSMWYVGHAPGLAVSLGASWYGRGRARTLTEPANSARTNTPNWMNMPRRLIFPSVHLGVFPPVAGRVACLLP